MFLFVCFIFWGEKQRECFLQFALTPCLRFQRPPGREQGLNVASEGEETNTPRWSPSTLVAEVDKDKEIKLEKMATTSKEEMFSKFQPWVLATYGDSAKTKTITLRKAARIRALLSSNDKVKHHRRKLMRWLVVVVLLGSCSRLVELFRQIRLSLMPTWISIILSYIETLKHWNTKLKYGQNRAQKW